MGNLKKVIEFYHEKISGQDALQIRGLHGIA